MIIFTAKNISFDFDKFVEIHKANKILDTAIECENKKMTKIASSGKEEKTAVDLMIKCLSEMGIKANIDIGELLKKLSEAQDGITKQAKTKHDSDRKNIVISSKNVKDPHYEFDITNDEIIKNGKSLIMVSAYMKEGYLGGYLIKRNYYFVEGNKKDAGYVYDDLVEKIERIKNRYHSGKIASKEIFVEIKSLLDSTKGDLESKEEDNLGTAHKKDTERGHELNGPMYSNSLPKG